MSKFVPIEVIQQTARNQRRARNLAAMHAVARAPQPCNCDGCRIQRCEIEGNTLTPCTGRERELV